MLSLRDIKILIIGGIILSPSIFKIIINICLNVIGDVKNPTPSFPSEDLPRLLSLLIAIITIFLYQYYNKNNESYNRVREGGGTFTDVQGVEKKSSNDKSNEGESVR